MQERPSTNPETPDLVGWCAADISRVQDDEVGDGTTSVVVLAGELLREAEQLVNQRVHPMTVIAGLPCLPALPTRLTWAYGLHPGACIRAPLGLSLQGCPAHASDWKGCRRL